jgi:hypothetical protein
LTRGSIRDRINSPESFGRSHSFRTSVKDFFNMAYIGGIKDAFVLVFKRHFLRLIKERVAEIIGKNIPDSEVK